MSGAPLVPSNVEGSPVTVTQQTIKLIDCPQCDQTLNITELNAGAKIKCPECENVTWAPEYNPKWWQRTKNIIIVTVGSFIIGIVASLTATKILTLVDNGYIRFGNQESVNTQILHVKSNKAQQTPLKPR